MRTIKDYLNDINDPLIQLRALCNLQFDKEDRIVENMEDAISLAFCWDDTPEGYDYWDDVRIMAWDHGL